MLDALAHVHKCRDVGHYVYLIAASDLSGDFAPRDIIAVEASGAPLLPTRSEAGLQLYNIVLLLGLPLAEALAGAQVERHEGSYAVGRYLGDCVGRLHGGLKQFSSNAGRDPAGIEG